MGESQYVKLLILFLVIGTPILTLAVSMVSSAILILIMPNSGVKRSGITFTVMIQFFRLASSHSPVILGLSAVNLRPRTVGRFLISELVGVNFY